MSENRNKILDERCGLVARTVHALNNSPNAAHRVQVSTILNTFAAQYSAESDSIHLEDWADNVLVELTQVIIDAQEELSDDNFIVADLLLYMTEALHKDVALKLGQRLAQRVLVCVA